MPWQSKAQAKWGHSAAGVKALGGPSAVAEWDSATTPGSLPERNGMAGALTAAAKERGRSKLAKANVESHSKNPHIRARGALGKRFITKSI